MIGGGFMLPATTQAFSVTNTSATDLGNGKALFTITYKFGFLNRETYMSIGALRSTSSKNGYVNYELMTGKNEVLKAGQVAGLVLSNTQIKDNQYYLPKGKTAEFTLVTIADVSDVKNHRDLALVITSLPFSMIEGPLTLGAGVAATELPAYRTKSITLK